MPPGSQSASMTRPAPMTMRPSLLPHPLSEDAVLSEEPVAYGGGLILGEPNAVVGPSRGDQTSGAATEDEAEVGGFGGGTLLLGYVLDGNAGDGRGRQLMHV